jgi:hypothetical protein
LKYRFKKIIKKLADLGKIRQGLPKLASCEFASNPPAYFKMRHLFLKATGHFPNQQDVLKTRGS